jgi:translation initiation factor 3 subunit C
LINECRKEPKKFDDQQEVEELSEDEDESDDEDSSEVDKPESNDEETSNDEENDENQPGWEKMMNKKDKMMENQFKDPSQVTWDIVNKMMVERVLVGLSSLSSLRF